MSNHVAINKNFQKKSEYNNNIFIAGNSKNFALYTEKKFSPRTAGSFNKKIFAAGSARNSHTGIIFNPDDVSDKTNVARLMEVNYIAASATEPTTSDLIIYTLKQKFLEFYASEQTKSWIDVFFAKTLVKDIVKHPKIPFTYCFKIILNVNRDVFVPEIFKVMNKEFLTMIKDINKNKS